MKTGEPVHEECYTSKKVTQEPAQIADVVAEVKQQVCNTSGLSLAENVFPSKEQLRRGRCPTHSQKP
jgi:hypothetical protein